MSMSELVHLPDYGHRDLNPTGPGPALCGVPDVRVMSAHEIGRGRITCPDCLTIHGTAHRSPQRTAARLRALAVVVEPLTHTVTEFGALRLDEWYQADLSTPCGTVACLAGHAIAIYGGPGERERMQEGASLDGDGRVALAMAGRHWDVGTPLFWPRRYGLCVDATRISGRTAAGVLRDVADVLDAVPETPPEVEMEAARLAASVRRRAGRAWSERTEEQFIAEEAERQALEARLDAEAEEAEVSP